MGVYILRHLGDAQIEIRTPSGFASDIGFASKLNSEGILVSHTIGSEAEVSAMLERVTTGNKLTVVKED